MDKSIANLSVPLGQLKEEVLVSIFAEYNCNLCLELD